MSKAFRNIPSGHIVQYSSKVILSVMVSLFLEVELENGFNIFLSTTSKSEIFIKDEICEITDGLFWT